MFNGLTIDDEYEVVGNGKDEETVGLIEDENDEGIEGLDRIDTLRLFDVNEVCERDFFEPRRLTRD